MLALLPRLALRGAWLLVLGLCGCDLLDGAGGVVCTLEARPAVVARVEAPPGLSAEGALARVRDGAYVDTARVVGGAAGLAHEREGRYTLDVTHPGFVPAHREGIVVGRDECHVRTVEVAVQLVPE